MRKVAWAHFTRMIQFDGRMLESVGPRHGAEFDPETYEIVVGDDRIPIAGNVRQYRLVDEPAVQYPCPECKGEYASLPALASHRSAKHQVTGARRAKGAAA